MSALALDDARNAEQAASYFAHIAKVICSGRTPADYDWAKAAEDDAHEAASEAEYNRILRMETFA